MDDFNANYYDAGMMGGDDAKQIYASQVQEDRINSIYSQLSPENVLFVVEQRLRGKRKDPQTNVWVDISETMSKLPEEAIWRYLSFLSTYLNQDVIMGNLGEMQINNIMRAVIKYLRLDIQTHAKEYGMEKNYAERTRIFHIMAGSVFFVLQRALNGQEAKRFWQSITLREFGAHPSQEKKGGIIDSLKFWK